MNTTPACTETPATVTAPEPGPNTIELPASKAENDIPHRKTANLPRKLRDLINTMLDDNRSAREILQALHESTDPPLPYELSEMCISRWRHSGYQRYLASQERLAEMRLLRENASDLMQDHDILAFHKAVNQIAVGEIFKSFMDDSLKDDPMNRTRTMNALSRLSREALVFKKYEDSMAKEQQPLSLPQLDENRPLNENEQNIIQDRWDRVFKIHPNHRRPKTPVTPLQSSSSSNPNPAESSAGCQPACPDQIGAVSQTASLPASQPSATAAPVAPPTSFEVGRSALDVESSPSAPPSAPLRSAICDLRSPAPGPNPESAIQHPESSVPAEPSSITLNPCSPARDSSEHTSENRSASPLETHNSQLATSPGASAPSRLCVESPPDLCPECGTPAPPPLPSGERPDPYCKQCGTHLPPPAVIEPETSHAE